MRRYNLLVFDWDGTVMDSQARIVNCLHGAIADLGLEYRDEGALKNIIGLGLKEAIDMLYPGQEEPFHHQFIERYRHHFLYADPTPTELFAGAYELLERLDAEGYLLGIATGKGRVGLDKVLDETGVRHLFHATRCADETFSKPHPQMLEQVMDHLGCTPAETLMIGDTEYDMEMAHNAGCAAMAVSYGVHALERLLRHRPVTHINAITEIYPWLQQNNPHSPPVIPGN